MNYPQEMLDAPRWLLYKLVDGKRKIPYQANGQVASSTDPETWCSYEDAVAGLETGGFAGLGFALGDGFSAIDLDNCIDSEGRVESWALDYRRAVDTTWEVSQSGKGIHLFYRGDCGPAYKEKREGGGGVECYSDGRFFALGTLRQSCPLAEFPEQFKRVKPDESAPESTNAPDPTEDDIARCRDKVMSMKESVEGENGHDALFAVTCEIARHNLDPENSLAILREYNAEKCYPPWQEYDLRRKIREGRERATKEGELGCRLVSEFDDLPIEMDDGPPRIIAFKDLRQYAGSIEWLAEDVLVSGQLATITGPMKSMKTGVSLDLAVSLATGSPFLGQFIIPKTRRVLVHTAEIGLSVAVNKLDAICEGKRICPFDEIDGAFLSSSVPRLKSDVQLAQLAKDIEEHNIDVLVIDPLGLAAGGADSRMLIEMGELLERVLRICNKRRCTLVIDHHANRTAGVGEPLTLNNISGAGVAEFARQWILLSHSQPYSHGLARLWMNVGGSAGHCGLYKVEINEGMQDGELLENRKWDVQVEEYEGSGSDENENQVMQVVGNGSSDTSSIASLTGLTKKEVGKVVGSLVSSGKLVYNGTGFKKVDELERLLS